MLLLLKYLTSNTWELSVSGRINQAPIDAMRIQTEKRKEYDETNIEKRVQVIISYTKANKESISKSWNDSYIVVSSHSLTIKPQRRSYTPYTDNVVPAIQLQIDPMLNDKLFTQGKKCYEGRCCEKNKKNYHE